MKKAPRKPRKLRPSLIQIMMIFAPVDRIFEELERDGTVNVSEKGEPIFRDEEGVWYPIAPALNGWIELWARLAEKGRFTLDLEPLRKLSNKLAYSAPLMEADVTAARAVVDECRRLFRGMDTSVVLSAVKTQQIAIEIENATRQGA